MAVFDAAARAADADLLPWEGEAAAERALAAWLVVEEEKEKGREEERKRLLRLFVFFFARFAFDRQ